MMVIPIFMRLETSFGLRGANCFLFHLAFIRPSFDLYLAFIQLPAFDVYRQGNDWVMVVLIFLSSFLVFYLLLFYTVTQRYP